MGSHLLSLATIGFAPQAFGPRGCQAPDRSTSGPVGFNFARALLEVISGSRGDLDVARDVTDELRAGWSTGGYIILRLPDELIP